MSVKIENHSVRFCATKRFLNPKYPERVGSHQLVAVAVHTVHHTYCRCKWNQPMAHNHSRRLVRSVFPDAMASVDSMMDLKCDWFHDGPMMAVSLDMVLLYEVNSWACCMLDVDGCWKKSLTPDRNHISELRRLKFFSFER